MLLDKRAHFFPATLAMVVMLLLSYSRAFPHLNPLQVCWKCKSTRIRQDWARQVSFGLSGLSQSTSTSSASSSLLATSSSSSSSSLSPLDDNPLLQDLNPSQVLAVTQPLDSIVRVISGPGSGKTRVLTSRIAWILQQQALSQSRERILGVTFTRKAAGEMQERLQQLVLFPEQQQQDQPQDQDPDSILKSRVTLGTFHSICAKILRWNGDLLSSLPSVQRDMDAISLSTTTPATANLDGSFVIIDDGDQFRILKTCLERAGNISLPDLQLKPRTILERISDYKEGLSQGMTHPFNTTGTNFPLPKAKQVVLKVYPIYREILLTSNCLDFDDLIYLTRDLLLHHAHVRERVQRHWSHVLVDEYQDTSRAQVDLVKLVTSQSLLVVGDADQSIYSWRGAHASSLSDFATEFEVAFGKKVHTVYLMENYRSTSNIIKAAQKIISTTTTTTTTSSSSSSNTVAAANRELRQKMKPQRGSGPAPRVIRFDNDVAEARFVATTVKNARAVGNYTADTTVALIYRTNAQSRALEEACVQANLPYVLFGSATSFYKRLEIKDSLCYLRWLSNGRDRSAMIRAMMTPRRGIGDSTLREFDEYCAAVQQRERESKSSRRNSNSAGTIVAAAATSSTPLDILISFTQSSRDTQQQPDPQEILSTRSLKALTTFAEQMQFLRNAAHQEPLPNVLALVIDKMELMKHFDRTSKSASESEERKQNVQELLQATQRYAEQGPCLVSTTADTTSTSTSASSSRNNNNNEDQGAGYAEDEQCPLRSFLDDVALVTDLAERSAEERFVVNLMTIHGSKGKEFDAVFVVGNEDGTIPTSQAIQEGNGSTEMEEEKRLLYVAMTRAKTELFLTWRETVPVFTKNGIQQASRKRSRFLDILVGKSSSSSAATKTTARNNNMYNDDKAYSTKGALTRKFPSASSTSATAKTKSTWPFRDRPKSSSRNVVVPPPKRKLEGTASVYAKPSSVASSRSIMENQRKASPSSTSLAVPLRERTLRTGNAGASSSSSSATFKPRKGSLDSPTKKTVDSTLFFPVGSSVVHKRYGKGVVLPKPQDGSSNNDAMLVHVEFESGSRRQFSAAGSDLTPALL